MNTPNNFLIAGGVVQSTIPTSFTLASSMNIVCGLLLLIILPILMILMIPGDNKIRSFDDLKEDGAQKKESSIAEEVPRLVDARRRLVHDDLFPHVYRLLFF